MNIIKVETDLPEGKYSLDEVKHLLEEVPDNSQIFFLTLTGNDLFFKRNNTLEETTMTEWVAFWNEAWENIGPTRNKARDKYLNDLPDSYFTKIIYKNVKRIF